MIERAPSSATPSRSASSKLERHLARLLEPAGIRFDGPNPWDPQIRNPLFFERLLRDGTLGLGESYLDGWWECDRLDELFARALRSGLNEQALGLWRSGIVRTLPAVLFNRQLPSRAKLAITRHYDVGNDLFERMLDARMIYSCAYWREACDLDAAQEAKLDLLCRKAQLARGQRVLDLGCGWGGFAQFAAERYGVEVVGITLSPSQAAVALQRCSGLPVEIRLQDYRALDERFDRIVSIGMLEHVGPKNYRTYFETLRRCLVDSGLAVIQVIGNELSRAAIDPWIARYVFPDAVLPSIRQLGAALEGRLVLEDWHNLGADYDLTLMAWHENVGRAWSELPRYDARFRRMWRYYLLSCAGTFRARRNQLWQLVVSKGGVAGGYRSIR